MELKERRILIIEDDDNVREATKTFLEMNGYTNIAVATDGADGLAQIHREKPSLVLLDRKMPGKDGLRVLQEIKDTYGDEIIVIMLTAYRDKEYITESMRKGAYNYLVKDDDPDLMLPTIESALRFHHKQQQRQAIENEIYELMLEKDTFIGKGYNFSVFKQALNSRIDRLFDRVIQTTITNCDECTKRAAQHPNRCCPTKRTGHVLPGVPMLQLPLLYTYSRADDSQFFHAAVECFLEDPQKQKVQSLVYVPLAEHASSKLASLLNPAQSNCEFLRYCCIYIFSDAEIQYTPEEKDLLRRFFDRFLVIMRMARLVDRMEFLRKNRQLGELATIVVHHISPLITPLMDALEFSKPEQKQRNLELVKDLKKLVDRFRHYSEGIFREYRFETVDLLEIIRHAALIFSLKYEEKIEVIYDFPERPIHIRGDADWIEQVFFNLFVNAAEAMTANNIAEAKIRVSVQTNETHVLAEVCDSGPGVPADIVPRLFRSYVSTKENGMGIGLPLTSEIIRCHDGEITYIKSKTPGAVFRIALPLLQGD